MLRNFIIITLSLFSISASADDSCEDKSDYKEIIQCLNSYAAKAIDKKSQASDYFYQHFERLASRYSLTPQDIRHSPMSEHFKVVVEERPLIGSKSTKNCFDFGYFYNRGRRIIALQKQIDEVALFLATIHATAWGNQVSVLFPIKEVALCSTEANEGRESIFSQRSLSLSVDFGNIQTADQMLQRWNEGEPIRKHDKGRLSGILRYLWNGRDKESALRDKIVDYWPALNPTGKLRTTALYTLVSAVKKLKTRLQNDNTAEETSPADEMQNIIREKGFSEKDRMRLKAALKDKKTTEKLYQLWQAKQVDPKNMLRVIEEGIGHSARRSKKLHMVIRDIKAVVSVTNDKTVTVRLLNLIKNSMPVMDFVDEEQASKDSVELINEKESLEIEGQFTDTVINKSKIRSVVAIDLIDDVLVSIQVPNINAASYRRITLYQALHEIIIPGENLGPL